MNITSENDSQRDSIFKSRNIDDYSGYVEGDYEASLGKKIKTLICASEPYIVYLDEQDYVEWAYNDKYEHADTFEDEFASVLNRISYLEEISNNIFEDNLKLAFRRLLGESLARLLSEHNKEKASDILNTAEQLLKTKNRQTIIRSALVTTSVVVVMEIILFIIYYQVSLLDWVKKAIELLTCSLSGGIGGFLFLMIRSKSLEIEPALSIATYKNEGWLRIVYGILGGLVVYLALNAKLIFGNIENPQFSILTFLICLIGGASEKIIPGLIEKIEGKL